MLSTHHDPFRAFTRDLQIEGCEVHLYRGPNAFGELLPKEYEWETEWWDTENTYFLAGVRPGLTKRAADSDVIKRNMIACDWDIRKELEKTANSVTDEEVKEVAEQILDRISRHPFWASVRYFVLSGNGAHGYWKGPPIDIVKEEFAAGMKDIFAELDTITQFPCDKGCGNAGRIMRMPGSWNMKDPANKKPVDFVVWMPNATLANLSFVQERGRVCIARATERIQSERKEFKALHPDGGSDVINLINQIPIEQVVLQLFAGMAVRAVKKDGGMRFSDEKGTERGFFKHKDFNVIVHEGTSLFDPPVGVGYNCLGLVKAVNKYGAGEAIEWFKERSEKIRETAACERTEWAKVKIHERALYFSSCISK